MAKAGGIDADELQKGIDRIERIEEEVKSQNADKKAIYDELKSKGFDTKAVRRIVALRKLPEIDRQAQEELVDQYKHAMGMS